MIAPALLILGPSDGSAFRLKGQAVTWTDFGRITHIASSSSTVYLATTGGLIRYNKMTRSWDLPMTGTDGAENELIRRVTVNDFDNKLFISTWISDYEFDPMFERWYPVPEIPRLDNVVRHIGQPSDLLPSPELNFVYDGTITDRHGRSFRLTDIVDDGYGDLWIGSDGYGAFKAGSSARIMEGLPYGLIQEDVSATFLSGDELWIGGRAFNSVRTGLTRFDLEENSFTYIESGIYVGFPSRDIYSLWIDDNSICCGTDDGLYITDTESSTYFKHIGERRGLAADEVLSLVASGDSLFVGTTEGINLLDMATDSLFLFKPGQFGGRIIYDLELIGPYLWIAADIGAFRVSLADGKMQQFHDRDGLIFSQVYDIEAYESDIWFASEAGLVWLDTETGRTEPFRDQMRVNHRRALAVNDTVAITATDHGMTIFYYRTSKKRQSEFSDQDGLGSSDVRSLILDGDYVWVGTDKGLTRFWWSNPDRMD